MLLRVLCRARQVGWRRRGGEDRGDIKILVAGLVPALILVVGLVVDGSGLLQARNQARWAAEQAARAGAQAVDLRDSAEGSLSINAERAARIAVGTVEVAGYEGVVSVSGPAELLVEATGSYHPIFWPADIEVTGSATVHLAQEAEE